MCLFVTVEFALMKFQINNILIILASVLEFFWKLTLMSFFLGVALVAGVFVICLSPWYYSNNLSNENKLADKKDEEEKIEEEKEFSQRRHKTAIRGIEENNNDDRNSDHCNNDKNNNRSFSPAEVKFSSNEMQLLKTFCHLLANQSSVDQTESIDESSATVVPNSSESGNEGRNQSVLNVAEDTESVRVKVTASLGGPFIPKVIISHVDVDEHVVPPDVEDPHPTVISSSDNLDDTSIREETVIEVADVSAEHFALKSAGGSTVFRNSLINELPEQVRDLSPNVSESTNTSSVRENASFSREREAESSKFRKSVILAGKMKSWSSSWREHSSIPSHGKFLQSISKLKPLKRQSTMLDVSNNFRDAQTSSNKAISIENSTMYKSLLLRKKDAGKISKEEISEIESEDIVSFSNQLQIGSPEFNSSNAGSSATEYFDASADDFYENSNLSPETNVSLQDLDESKGEEITCDLIQGKALSVSELYQNRDETFQKDKHTFKRFCKSLPTKFNKVKMTRGFHFKDHMLVHDKGKMLHHKEGEIMKPEDS